MEEQFIQINLDNSQGTFLELIHFSNHLMPFNVIICNCLVHFTFSAWNQSLVFIISKGWIYYMNGLFSVILVEFHLFWSCNTVGWDYTAERHSLTMLLTYDSIESRIELELCQEPRAVWFTGGSQISQSLYYEFILFLAPVLGGFFCANSILEVLRVGISSCSLLIFIYSSLV